MTQRAKLELPLNKPVELELLYDEPVSGSSQFGKYSLFAVLSDGVEYSFFAPEEINDQLKSYHKGEKVIVTKLAAQRGTKLVTTYEVKASGVKERVRQPISYPESTEESAERDRYFEVMLQSYRDGLEISRELNGMADPEKIAVTLFIARSKSNGY